MALVRAILYFFFTQTALTDSIKFRLDVYYESYCEPCRLLFLNQLLPLSFMYNNISIVPHPYGLTEKTEFGFQCPKGPHQCKANRVLNAIVDQRRSITTTKLIAVHLCLFYRKFSDHEINWCLNKTNLDVIWYHRSFNILSLAQLEKEGIKTRKANIHKVPTVIVQWGQRVIRFENEEVWNILPVLCEMSPPVNQKYCQL